MEHFNKPLSIWKHAFENQVSPLSQSILVQLCACGTPFFLNDLRQATSHYISPDGRYESAALDSVQFTRAVREIDGSFVRTDSDSDGTVTLDFHNPSVRDFLFDYIGANPAILIRVLTTAIFGNQLFTLFRPAHAYVSPHDRRILISSELNALRRSRVIAHALSLPHVELHRMHFVGGTTRWVNWYDHPMRKLRVIVESFDMDTDTDMRSLVIRALSPPPVGADRIIERSDYIFVLKAVAEFIKEEMCSRVEKLFEAAEGVYELMLMKAIREVAPDEFSDFIQRRGHEYVKSKVDEVVESELRSAGEDILHNDIDELSSEVEDVMTTFDIERQQYKAQLDQLAQKRSDAVADVQPTKVPKPPKARSGENDDESVIDALFQSLISGPQMME